MSYHQNKSDSGKPRLQFLPWAPLREVAAVMDYGARKYKPQSWQRVPDAEERYRDALLRHLWAYLEGEKRDPETDLHHLAHAACNCLFLVWFESARK